MDERLKDLSAKGDALERLNRLINFELFRDDLAHAMPRSDGSKGGRPPFDLMFMFKVLILQASCSLSDERTEFPIKERPSFMRFLGSGPSSPVPDANAIWTFREAHTRAEIVGKPAIAVLFSAYKAALRLIEHPVMAAKKLNGDDTPVPILANGKTETGQARVNVRDDRPFGGTDPPALLFRASRDRSGDHPNEHLRSFTGILQADAYVAYNRLLVPDSRPAPIVEALC